MSTNAETCVLEDELETLARRMTELRARHLPLVDSKLKAIVSIGDIVENRLDDRGTRPALRIRAAPVTARAARHVAVNGRRERPAT
jgi:hypothetical protein